MNNTDTHNLKGVALDIGTTNVVLSVYDLKNKECLMTESFKNPQVRVAADVMGRIAGAMKGRLREEQELILKALGDVISASGYKEDITKWVICGNTAMLYLLTGKDPSCMASYPFEADCLFDYSMPVLSGEAYFPKCMSAFVGADITCGILETGMCCKDATSLLVDIGTNAEMALWKNGELYISSAAAGPAFERKKYKGSEMVDMIASMLKEGIIDMYGTYSEEYENENGGMMESISLSQSDVRAVQLAKGAVAAGIRVLMEETRTSFEEIENFYIAGVFGENLNTENAARIGLVPKELVPKAKIVGNSALKGATRILLEDIKGNDSRLSFTLKTHPVLLAEHGRFNRYFIEEMNFC